ncbi:MULTISPECIES: hypothetical protein [Pseudomonas]|nr:MULTISPECIES: hypothetical protein [Pseudomonas]MCO7502748.1 hypothetical protein [Pseudomonas sp. VE 267-6A]MCP8350234.1 hypothetical protein [Pseudomonas sp. FBF18]MCQ0168921.1 hypothetical protein [Pseudomonas sp. S12(2018)]MBG8558073.1 hypothetical protein [Pseudomonas qingdaonensis]MCO7530427.1 hypothetical protein [Pseudomonas sp. 2]
MMKRESRFWKVFGMPGLIALLGAVGLFAALLGDGPWDVLAWVGLALPVGYSLRGFWPAAR